MKFKDYFAEAIKYGESLGFIDTTDSKWFVQLGESKKAVDEAGEEYRPTFIGVWDDEGIEIGTINFVEPQITPQQQIKLVLMFANAYEKYLSDAETLGVDEDGNLIPA
ncbi:hypothetical protein [Liquorilactobacillus capillatus]|uniref:Uncharacterized protein n=1 Tax=Liquorilactobacillus capillatus DSM 19910 TaxID=1423731 RepID=A0A0R1MBK6_9LACO|nr:hypothetical protein [Liquorilactobacillus capillatus]KRL02498.1 hypothetical protein FC81_GL000663 [Liquorilactobacillus capillatus DSM 19910]